MQDSNIQTDPIYQPDDFQFQPIDEMFDLDFDAESVQGMGDYMKNLEALAPAMNQYAMPLDLPISKHNSPKPGFDNFESFKKVFNSPTPFLGGEQQMKLQDPIISGIKSSSYDRYARMDAFDKLGWRPDMDMESYYNANTTGWDDFKRSWGPWWTNFSSGFTSAARSWGDLFSGDESYWTSADLEGATAMSEANRLGASTRGGTTGFLVNLNLNAAQTLGTISEIAAEELALAAAGAALTSTGAGAPAGIGAFVAGTGKNFVKGIKSIGNIFDITRTVRLGKDVLSTLRTADKAKDFWSVAKAGGRLAGDFFTPELRATLKSFKSSESAARGLSNLAKTSKSFGAFYRDARAINLTMSESKLEAGFAYQDMFAENVERVMRENGGAQLTPEQLNDINIEALKAATNSVLFNAPAIFITNKIVLGKALGGFSPQLRRIFNKVGNSKNIVRKTTVQNFIKNRAAGKTAGKLFQETSNKSVIGKLFGWNKLKALGVKGSLKYTAGGILRYSAGGLSEGLQEVYQEGVAVGLVDYHSALLDTPNANRHDLQKAAMMAGIDSQTTGQGFETFLSGFLMGGLVQGPQRLMFEVLPSYIQEKRNPKDYAEYKKQRDEFVDKVNDIAEEVAKDPANFMSSSKLNFFSQKQSEDDGDKHMFEDSELGLRDSNDDSFIMNAHHMVANGTEGLYIEQLEDIQKLSDEALIEAYPNQKEDIESGKFKERVDKSIERIKNFKKDYDASFNIIENPYAFKQFEQGSKEYNIALAKYSAVEHGRLLYLLSKESFKSAANRRDAIEQALKLTTAEGSADVNDLTPLLAVDSIQREVALLSSEIEALENAENIDKTILDSKKDKLVALTGYLVTLQSIEDKEAGVYDRDKMEVLKTPLKAYIESVSKNVLLDDEKLSYLVKQLVDHSYLDKRAQVYARSVSMFSDQAKFTEMSDRLSEVFLTRFNNIKRDFKASVIKGMQNQERVSLLEALAAIGSENKNGGVYAETEQSIKFMETGDASVLVDFYTEAGKVFKSNSNELYGKIQTLIDNYNRVKFESEKSDVKAEETKTDVNKKDTSTDKKSELNDYLKLSSDSPILNVEDGIDILKENESPFSKLLLEDLYSRYKQQQRIAKEPIVSKADWINTTEGTNAVAALEKLKGIWLASESNKALTDQAKNNIAKSEEGFQEWILSQKDDASVYRSLEFGGLKATDVERNETNEGFDSVVEDNPLLEWADKGPGVNILKKEIASIDSIDDEDVSDVRETIYTLTDNSGNRVSDDLLDLAGLDRAAFTDFQQAVDAFEELKKVIPDTTPFNFDGVTLKNLDVVEDANGNKFRVLGTASSANNGAKLELISLEKQDTEGVDKALSSFTVEQSGFSDLYTKVEETFEGVKLSANAVKLLPSEVNGIYPKSFGPFGTDTDVDMRFNKVLSLLSPEQLSTLEIKIRPNPNQSSNFLRAGDDTTENKLIVRGDKYTMEVVIPENMREGILERMDGFSYPENWDGAIGFVRNDHFRFTNNGNQNDIVEINQLEDKVIERYITPDGVSVSEMKQEMLKQKYLTLKIDELMKDKTNATITMADLESLNFSFKVTGGQYEDTNSYDTTYDNLDQNKYDGHKIVIVNTRNVDSIGERFETDIEDPQEHLAFVEKVISELESTPVEGGDANMYQKAISKGGYVGIIKDPLTGKIVLARLVPRNLEVDERNELFTELITKAKEVRDSKTGTQPKQTTEAESLKAVQILYQGIYGTPYQQNVGGPGLVKLEVEVEEEQDQNYVGIKFVTTIISKKGNSIKQNEKRYVTAEQFINEFNLTDEELDNTKPATKESGSQSIPLTKEDGERRIAEYGQEKLKLEKVGSGYGMPLRTYLQLMEEESTGKITVLSIRKDTANGNTFISIVGPYGPLDIQVNREPASIKQAAKSQQASKAETTKSSMPLFDWNKQFNNKFFSATNPTEKTYLDLQVTKSGDIVLRVKVGAKGSTLTAMQSFKSAELDNLKPEDILSLYSLLNQNQKVIDFNAKSNNILNFGEHNLKTTFPLDATLDQILNQTKTNLDSRVLKGVRVKLETTDEMVAGLKMVQASKPVNAPSDEYSQFVDTGFVSQETLERIANKEANKPGSLTLEEQAIYADKVAEINKILQQKANVEMQEDIDLQAMSEERYNEYKSKDFKDLPREIKIGIVNQVVQEGRESLTERQQEILKVNNDELELLIMSKSYTKPVEAEGKTLEQEIAEVEEAIKKEKKRIANEAKRTGQHQATLRKNSKIYVSLVDKLDELEKRSTDESAFKILDPSETLQKEESIDEFLEWAAVNLPDFIKIKDLSEIKTRLKSTGTTVGQFTMALRNIAGGLSVEGTIYTGPSNGIGYHESFHAVFRMLLTTEEQNNLLKLAKDEVRKKFKTYKALQEDISKFANRHPKYRQLSKAALEREYLEEYMADQFQAFKTNPRSTKTSSTIKSFFNRVVEWIKSVLKSFRKNELDLFYERIDAGKYRNTQILDNQYTNSLESGVAIDAFKAIPYKIIRGTKLKSAKYLDPAKADMLTRMIGQVYVTRRGDSKYSELQDEELLSATIIDFADLYDSEKDIYASLSDVDLDTVEQLNEALNLQEGKAVKESVTKYLDILNLKFDEMDDQIEEDEDDYGSRKVGDYTKDANQTGGYNSATKEVRTFIAGVSIDSKDMFGNVELQDGTPIRVPVNHIDVYNGLMLAGMNETSDSKMLEKLYYFSRRNENTAAVIDELFRVTGIDINEFKETGQIPNKIDNSMLFNQFMTTFKNARFDYIFQLTDPTTGKVRIISASNRDAANAQIDYWKKIFNDKFEIFRTDNASVRQAVSGVAMLSKDMEKKKITNKDLKAKSLLYSKLISEQLGIKLSPLYIEISIANNLSGKLTKYQETLIDMGKNARLLRREDLTLITTKLTGKEKSTGKPLPENLFIDDSERGLSSRLKQIALGNALFDETVGNTVFEDPERNLIYAHQNQTFHSRRMIELSDDAVIRKLQEQFPDNTLLNSEAFLELSTSKQLQLIRTAGSNMLAENVESMDLQEADDLSRQSVQGTKYGKFNSVEFTSNLINSYFERFNTKSNKVETAANTALAPVFIRLIESSNTGDSVGLPVIKAVKLSSDGKDVVLTPEAFDQFVNRLRTEYNIIQKNNQDYDKNGPGNIKGYNDSKNGRGFKFFKGDSLISKETQAELIKSAVEGKTFDEVFGKEYKTELNNIIKDYIKEFQGLAQKARLTTSQHVKGIFPDTEKASSSMEKLNVFRKNEPANLAQIFISNWLNTMAINELILGEEAKLFKDAVIDPIKRAKMQNAAHDSIAFDFLPKDDSLGISHTLGRESIGLFTFTDPATEDGGDKADAQSYQTAKGARYSAYGLGSLNSALAKMYDAIDNGESVDNDWFSTYLKQHPKHAPLNSKKYVFGNGQTFIKTSTVVLTKELTSYKNEEGAWVAKVGMERLHNLRENMERWESQNDGKIAIAAPESAVKMLKQNVIDNESMTAETMVLNEEHVTLLDAKDFGRQMVNPSNKLLMTDASQIKTIITSEQAVLDKDFKVVIDGEELPIADVVKEYHRFTAAGVNFEYSDKKNLIFDLLPHLEESVLEQMDIEPNLYSFIKTAQANLKSSAASSTEVEFFTEEDGKPKYELNNPITSQKFEQFFMAYFSKKVLSQKVPGVTLALMSDFGVPVIREIYSFDTTGRPDKQRVVRRKNSNQYNGQNLLDITNAEDLELAKQQLESDPSKPIVVLDRLRYDMKEYDMVNPNDPSTWVATNIRYAETLMPAHHEDVMRHLENKNIKDLPDSVAKMFAVRIPTQDKHSSIPSKVVDFLPVFYGSTAIFPEDLIKVSGADFDIDKVYAAIKEWYYKDGKFTEYGTRKGSEGFADYIRYTNKKVAERGSNLNEALLKYNAGGLAAEVESKSIEEIMDLLTLGYSPEAIDASIMLGLPITEKEYNKYIKDNGVEPYKASITNKLVSLKYSLVGNTKLTETTDGSVPVSYQPADIEAVKEVWESLSNRFEILKTYTKDGDMSIDNLIGQFYSHKNVKENSGLIGAVVPPATIINFLKEMNVSSEWFSLDVDGISYNRFTNKSESDRTHYIISNLITLATDDAKERLLSKLGYNKKGIKLVLAMVSFGIPLEQASMLVNVKAVREILEESESPMSDIRVARKDLLKRNVEAKPVTTASLGKGIEGDVSDQELLGLLNLVIQADALSGEIDNLQAIFSLNKGFGKDFSSLMNVDDSIDKAGLYLSNQEMQDSISNKQRIFDLRNAFSTDLSKDKPVRHYIGEYIRIFEDFKRNVLPEVFTSQSPDFKRILQGVLSYTKIVGGKEGAKVKAQIQKDMLSYFTIKAYMKDLFDREAGSLVGGSLTNEFLYPSENSDFNITTVFKDLKNNFNTGDNYFLDYFVFTKTVKSEDNKTGMNIATTRSFGKLSDNEKVRIQNGFQALYGDIKTRKEAVHILHYIMAKDGLSLAAGSLLQAITPFGLEKYLGASTEVFKTFKGQNKFEDVFGQSLQELSLDFINNYGMSASFASNIKADYTVFSKNSGYSTRADKDRLTVVRSDKDSAPMIFPKFIFRETKNPIGVQKQYYKLVSGSLKENEVSVDNIDASLLTEGLYEKFDLEGSYYQNGIGFIFDNENFKRPKTFELYTTDRFDAVDVNFDTTTIPDDVTMPEGISELSSLNNVNRVATEKGIEVGGKNIADITDKDIPEGIKDAADKLLAFTKKGSPATQTSGVTINNKKWTKDSPKENLNTAYVFTENINSIGDTRVGGGSAVIRNNPNAVGIVTKKYYTYKENRDANNKEQWNANFQDTDADFELFKKVNLEQFAKLDKFDSKIFPDSFANSLAAVPNRFALWLQNELQTRYGLVTEVNSKGTGLISKSVQPTQPTQQTSEVETGQLDLFDVSELQSLGLPLTDNFSILLEDLKTTPGAIQKMKEDGVNISDLNSLKESFKKSAFTEESQYEEHLRKCYLK